MLFVLPASQALVSELAWQLVHSSWQNTTAGGQYKDSRMVSRICSYKKNTQRLGDADPRNVILRGIVSRVEAASVRSVTHRSHFFFVCTSVHHVQVH